MKVPALVAVDLTPVLPGGENGGAKVFALEIVRRLARLAPSTQFVLLTQAASHDELARLDAPNVRRLQVLGPAATTFRSRLFAAVTARVARFPAIVRQGVARVGYGIHTLLKRGGSRSAVETLGADALLCPFTAPTYRAPGVRTVCTIYDLQFRAYPQFFAVEDVVLRERSFTEACRHADALAAISDFSRDAAIAATGLEPARITTIPLRLAREPASGKMVSDTKFFLYPANFWKHKNHEMLLTAFGMAQRMGLPPSARLVCTGAPGARRDALADAARRMGLAAQVSFPGFVSDEEMARLTASATAVIIPSLYEGFGLPVVDAMAAGIPVACSNTTALPEVAGGAALLFDPRIPEEIAHAIVALATDTALRERLVAAGLERAREFADADRMAREYWDLLTGTA